MIVTLRIQDFKGERQILEESFPYGKIGVEAKLDNPSEEILLDKFEELKKEIKKMRVKNEII